MSKSDVGGTPMTDWSRVLIAQRVLAVPPWQY